MKYIVAFLLFVFSFSAFSFEVRPMVSEIKPSGSQSQQTFRVYNGSKEPLTIDIEAYNLSVDSNGQEKLEINDQDFLIIPLTSIVQPGKSQSVIVRYIGEPVLSASKAYRIAVNQVAVNLDEANVSGIGMTVSFQTLLNVVPDNAQAKVIIKNKKQVGKDIWSVELENKGNKFVRLTQSKWMIHNKDGEFVLEGKELSQSLSGKIMLPNSKSTVRIRIPSEFNASDSDLKVVL
ncbi:MAG: molecular chaperone [Marinomonas sp.]|uniref:molecular chaperone n=1 Tax=Marinomonas sp. TaxID=1904862 RepID=UPI003C72BA85